MGILYSKHSITYIYNKTIKTSITIIAFLLPFFLYYPKLFPFVMVP